MDMQTLVHFVLIQTEGAAYSIFYNSAPCTQTSLPTNSFQNGGQRIKPADPSIYAMNVYSKCRHFLDISFLLFSRVLNYKF